MSRFPFLALVFFAAQSVYSDGFPPKEVKIEGDMQFGDTSEPVECAPTPKYHAMVFNAHGGDRVEVTVTAEGHRAHVSIADPSLNELAKGEGRVTFVLPDRGPDIEAYYIVFRDADEKPAKFVVSLKKLAGTPSQ